MSAASARARLYLEFARPFTLFAPALGMASGGATAIGAAPVESWRWALVTCPALGAVMAAVLNAASNGNFWLLQLLGLVMTTYGVYVCYLMLRRPEELAVEENHVSWAHMYRMMFVAQIGFALAYLL